MPFSCFNNILLYSYKWAHQYLDFSLLGLNTALPYLTFPGLWPSWTRVNWLTAADKQSFHSPSGTALPGLGMSLACDWSAPEHFPSASPPQPAGWILSNSLTLVLYITKRILWVLNIPVQDRTHTIAETYAVSCIWILQWGNILIISLVEHHKNSNIKFSWNYINLD